MIFPYPSTRLPDFPSRAVYVYCGQHTLPSFGSLVHCWTVLNRYGLPRVVKLFRRASANAWSSWYTWPRTLTLLELFNHTVLHSRKLFLQNFLIAATLSYSFLWSQMRYLQGAYRKKVSKKGSKKKCRCMRQISKLPNVQCLGVNGSKSPFSRGLRDGHTGCPSDRTRVCKTRTTRLN